MIMTNVSFHEATVVAFWKEGGHVGIRLSDVSESGRKIEAAVDVLNVTNVISDGRSVDDVSMVYEDGEVLTLEHTAQVVELIVQWNDFARHKSLIRSYHIEGEVKLRLTG